MRSRLLALTALLALCAAPASAAGPLRPGQPAPAFTLTTIAGPTLSLASLRGKAVYVNYFASWCGPCNEEAPDIVALQNTYKSKGLTVVGIDDEESAGRAGDFAKKYKLPYPVVLGTAGTRSDYGAIALPVHVFIDRKGVVKYYRLGEMNRQEIEAQIKAIL